MRQPLSLQLFRNFITICITRKPNDLWHSCQHGSSPSAGADPGFPVGWHGLVLGGIDP